MILHKTNDKKKDITEINKALVEHMTEIVTTNNMLAEQLTNETTRKCALETTNPTLMAHVQ